MIENCDCDTLDTKRILNSHCKKHYFGVLTCPNCKLEYIPFYDDQSDLDYCMGCLAKKYPKYWNMTSHHKHMNKEEAIAFTMKYLEVRKREDFVDENHKHYEPFWTWRVATDYVLNDIIPFLYGEALD